MTPRARNLGRRPSLWQPPMHATERVRVSRLIAKASSELGDRRRMRRASAAIRLEDGTSLRAREQVSVTTSPLVFHLADQAWTATLVPPWVLALHKPPGVITSRHEPGSAQASLPTVLPPEAHEGAPVGRLDAMASGLLLVTEDGQLCHRLAHPRYAVPRTYLAGTVGELDASALSLLQAGELVLRDGHRPVIERIEKAAAPPTGLVPPSEATSWWEVTLAEGKYHEVRRMLAACSLRVVCLLRTHYGPLSLTQLGLCASTPWRWLSREERAALYASVRLEEPPPVLRVTPLETPPAPMPPASPA